MSITAIIIIGLSLAMMLGPIMLMQPSRYQKQLVALRSKALVLGLRVRLQDYQNRSVSVYQRPWPITDARKWDSVEWRLEKKAYTHDIHFSGLWDWVEGQEASKDCCDLIQPVLDTMPEGVNALLVTKLGVECFWDERGGELALKQVDHALSHLSLLLWPLCFR